MSTTTNNDQQLTRQQIIDELYLDVQQRLEEERLEDLQDQQLLSDEDQKLLEQIQLAKRKLIRAKRSRRSYNKLIQKLADQIDDNNNNCKPTIIDQTTAIDETIEDLVLTIKQMLGHVVKEVEAAGSKGEGGGSK